MKVVIKTVARPVVDYIIDSLSGNYGWEPISSIDPEIVSRFMTINSRDYDDRRDIDMCDIELTDKCKLEAKSDYITIRYREHLATLDSKDFEKVVIV